jgi:outer membrane receptor protein involved in Fe transport
VELTTTYDKGPFNWYGNLAIARQYAKGIESGQFNFAPADLATVDDIGIQTDHSQLMTASAGMSYLWKGTRFSVNLLAGTGTRTTQPNGPINGASVPSWEQVNLGVTHRFDVPGAGAITLRFDVINLFDESYLLRSSTSIGAFSPAYGPRRTFFGGVSKEF